MRRCCSEVLTRFIRTMPKRTYSGQGIPEVDKSSSREVNGKRFKANLIPEENVLSSVSKNGKGLKANGFAWKNAMTVQKPINGLKKHMKNGMSSANGSPVRMLSTGKPVEENEELYQMENDLGDGSGENVVKGRLKDFRISKTTRHKLKENGIKHLFDIQSESFDHIYDGKDLVGQARTGTGKTLSFVLPLVERLNEEMEEGAQKRGRPPVVLVMAPTRELSLQTFKEFETYGQKLASSCIYGGAPYEPQERALRNGLDILVGTPGRIMDHMQRGNLNLSEIKHVVLDEADHMLERGFADQMDAILSECYEESHEKPQTLLFSATVPSWVQQTARRYMSKDRVIIDLIGKQTVKTATTVQHKAIACPYHERASTIADVLQVYSGQHGRAIVFTSTKKEANELVLNSVLKQECQVLHGDIPQKQREITLQSFRDGKFQCLVATDVAARGLDIPEVDLVIQTEPPMDVDSYIHRSGRTGRAGRTGVCIMFYKNTQQEQLREVERRAGIKIDRIGAPQQSEIVKAAGSDASRCLEQISPSVIPMFTEAAKKLIEEKGPNEALAAALAYISGITEFTERSLLSSMSGFTTYFMKTEFELRGLGFVWTTIERSLPPEVKESVKGIRMCEDMKGAVFDVPNKFDRIIQAEWRDSNRVSLIKPDSLPKLQDRPSYSSDRGQNNRWRSNGPSFGTNQFQRRNGYSRGGASNRGGYGNRGGYRNY